MAAAAGKKTRGRQKIAIQRIENEEDRQVTFSKRKSGIYKKANELATLCGAEVAVLFFSQAGRAYNFGSPSIESVAHRFLSQTTSSDAVMNPTTTNPPLEPRLRSFEEIHRSAKINELSQRHNEIVEQVDVLKARQDELGKMMMTGKKAQLDWWEIPIGEMSQDQLRVTEFLWGKVAATVNEKAKENHDFGSASTSTAPGPSAGGAGGSIC